MNTAKNIIQQIAGASAVTLAGGYAVRVGSERALFEPARIEHERRNKRGRVTYCEAHYQDGSVVEFRYSETLGASWRVVP